MTNNNANRQHRYVIIGAGMAGILAAIKLREAGKHNIRVYEKADRIGGTWRENTYPGLTCDVPSHSYTYSFAPNPEWSRHLPPGAEVQAYFESVVAKYNLEDIISFNEEITQCEFSDDQWHIKTSRGNSDCADFVIAATGVLHHPRIPRIEGMETFKGDIFHSARWDHSVALDNKRIAVVGTGSTGVQIVTALADRAATLCHYQRTPQWIMPVVNGVFSEEEKVLFRNDPVALKGIQNDPELEANIERFSVAITEPDSAAMHEIENIVTHNLEQSISDPELRERLRPQYRAACKRLIYSENFYVAAQKPNVDILIEGVDKIEENGIRSADGTLREFDVIVLATGFEADRFMRPMTITGENGVTLEQAWSERPSAYMSVSIPDFPNFFMLNGPSGPVGNFSLIEIAEHQWHYISQLMALVENGVCRKVSASQYALSEFDKARIAAAKKSIFGSGCQSWYLDAQGIPATWPWTRSQFKEAMKKPNFAAYCLG
ncbi:NAD(P)/FAD-dependent oxidoreductase [uncultured Zhongshania sp.]|jgi:cation diffusion facilitator CzcD-associated flavoprotein CzcO|uniref:flavin-containing monooxygenase n=1 Tax=uncultured Zhongshania sp. TaxID=1642288 RepID=UPI00260055E2|nr:NAD(P)/FAD-dependent oxidoreductase [uncultured Zhongshania sp.]